MKFTAKPKPPKPEQLYPTGKIDSKGDNLRALARDETAYVPPLNNFTSTPRLDAIAIPTHRKRTKIHKVIKNVLELAEKHGVGTVIVLCSDEAHKEDIAELSMKHPGQRWLAIDWQKVGAYREFPFATTQSVLSRGKNFNVSEKRNFTLELAKLMGWKSVLFIDDDMEVTLPALDKAASLLSQGAEVVGFNVREYPDHSVVVHANQAVNSPVDCFIGAGAMAVRTDSSRISFFPNAYNNDWLFSLLYSLTSDNGLVWAGTLRQKPYKPFQSTSRSEREEPGDLLAEGLFRLAMEIRSSPELPASPFKRLKLLEELADQSFWEKEMTARINFIQATISKAKRKAYLPGRLRITQSLNRSLEVINGYDGMGGLSSKDFTFWIKAWVKDIKTWNDFTAKRQPAKNLEDALATLGYRDRFMYGGGVKHDVVDSGPPARRHALYSFLKSVGESRFDEAMFSHDNHKFMEEYTSAKGNNLLRIVHSADKLRYDRPLTDTGVKPAMSVVMFVKLGESVDTVKKSVRTITKHARGKSPIQLTVWVYTDHNDSKRQLHKYRNLLVSGLMVDLQDTNVMLSSGVVKVRGRNQTVDQIIRLVAEDTLLAYWKLGRRPLPGHRFVVINSENEPLRVGTLRQLLRHEHVIADKSLAAYIEEYHEPAAKPVRLSGKGELNSARERLGKGAALRDTLLNRYLRRYPTIMLMLAMARAKINLPVIDELAHSVEFHDPRGWTSIHDRRSILCATVDYRQSLPGDVYGIARKIMESTKRKLKDREFKGCMVVVVGRPEDPWSDLQQFRESIISTLTKAYDTTGIVFTSMVYRQDKPGSHTRSPRIARALCRYVYWLENHRVRQNFSWLHLKK